MNRSKNGIEFSRIFEVIGPGSIKTTLMPVSFNSRRKVSVRPSTAYLVATYAPPPGKGDEAQDRRILNDSPMPLRPHDRNHLPRQFVPAKEVCFENLAQTLGRQILDRAGQAVRAVVEQCIQRATCGFKHFVQPGRDTVGIRIVDLRAFKALRPQAIAITLLAAGRKNAPAAGAHAMGRIQADAG